jgi:hypothetical protein
VKISNNLKDKIPSAPSCENVETKTKKAAQGIWTMLMIITIGMVVYSLMYKTPKLINKIFDPVNNFADSYVPNMSLPNRSISIIAIYLSIFISLGLYGFVL